MKAATVKEIKTELTHRSQTELIDICLRLSKFKKENKELLTYLLYEIEDESAYIRSVNEEVDKLFSEINMRSFYFIRKSVRKILSTVKKYIRYSQKKQTEVELLIHFCKQLKTQIPGYKRSTVLKNVYQNQVNAIIKALNTLHEDLQFDYEDDLKEISKG